MLDAARFEIARSVAWNRGEEPPDKANPKAVLAYLQAHVPPVNPARDPHKRWKRAQGLAEDVRFYGRWMRDEAEKRIGHLYPQVELTEQATASNRRWSR